MTTGLIWAQSSSGVIGRGNRIPWQLPEDQARFKQITSGHTVVMGRLTWDSLPKSVRPLPGRRNVVVTRHADFHADGADVVTTIDDALAGPQEQTWVIGGAEIYLLALPLADVCEVTEVEIDLHREDEDVMAPLLDESWQGATGEWRDSKSGLRYRFSTFTRL